MARWLQFCFRQHLGFASAGALAGFLAQSTSAVLAQGSPPSTGAAEDARPLSAAQIALFETPHLQNVTHPETISYHYVRGGPGGFSDTVAMHIRKVNADGTKYLTFEYLNGPHRVTFPEIDNFRGNPLLVFALQNDVDAMRSAIGVSASYLRNRIRESFVEDAAISEATAILDGQFVTARRITIHPFANEARLERIPSLQAKTYSFVLANDVPGMISEIAIETPYDPAMQVPAMSEHLIFKGVGP